MLYRIHLRLCEIFQTTDPFGGKSIILVGDLMQLPPVKGSYVFLAPNDGPEHHLDAYYDVFNLWMNMKPFILQHNHRQNEQKSWATTLNKLREGQVDDEDVELLKSRITDEPYLDENYMHIFYENKDVNDLNTKMLNKINGTLYECPAIKVLPKGYQSTPNLRGTVDTTQFMENLQLKIGARCMLIFNVSTVDGLVNGSIGTIVGIELNKKNIVECVIVNFDDNCGEEQRRKYPQMSSKYESQNGTPIFRFELEYPARSKKGFRQALTAKVIQFPIRLCYAWTAHKSQVRC